MKPAATLAELEAELGNPQEFTLNPSNVRTLRLWASAIGIADIDLFGMTNVALVNLYHERGGKINTRQTAEIQRIAAEIFTRVVETVQSARFDPASLRTIIQEELANVAPKRLEVISPRGSIVLDGLLHYSTETVIKYASINQPIMMVGPAGCGKTTIGEHVAKALQLPFYITSTITESFDLTGFVDGRGTYHTKPFREAFEKGGIWIADEIDAWDAAALLAANSALANGYMVFPDSSARVHRHPDFRMIATANTFGHGADRVYVGRNQLDAATLDRFATINVDYDLNLEQVLANGNMEWLEFVWDIRKKVEAKKIRHVVSTRAIVMGAAALAIGVPREDVEEINLFKGMSEKDREKLEDD